MRWSVRCRRPALLAGLLLPVLAGVIGYYRIVVAAPRESTIEQWGVLAAVQDGEALHTLRQRAGDGSVVAARVLGQVLAQRQDPATVREGRRWLTEAAQQGDGRAELALGKLLFQGAPGVDPDIGAAQPRLEAAVRHGQPGAAHYLGLLFRQDRPGRPRAPEQALHWLGIAAQAGVADSQFLLGQMLLTGDGTAPDPAAAQHWFELAAEQDQPEANLQLLMASLRHETAAQPDAEGEKRLWMEAQHSLRHRPPPP